jgi:hypothetical protein
MRRGGQAIATPGIRPGTELVDASMAGAPNEAAFRIGSEEKSYDPKLSFIAGRLSRLATDQVRLKEPVERRWLASVRAFHGKYEASFIKSLEAAAQSTAYIKLTRAKTVALEARLFDLMFPTDDRNWDVEPTPVPKLAGELKEAETRATSAANQANQAEAAGDVAGAQQIVMAGNDQASRANAAANEIAAAEAACKLMREEIDDQLTESKYPAECRSSLHDMCLLGSGILKGPMVNESTRGRWLPVKGGAEHDYQLQQQDDARPMVRRVDPWSFFPDMSARCIEECEFFFERYLWTNSDLRKMVRTQGFDPDAVRELLRGDRSDKPVTDPSINNLISLRSITEESTGSITGRLVGWEYHGPLECEEVCAVLRAMGRDKEADEYEQNDDPLVEHRVIVHFCDGVILKIAPEWPLDSGDTLYSMANLEDAEGQLFGYGVPTIMEDSQTAANSAWRAALDNAALSVGPQVLAAKDEIQPADGDWAFKPKKMWWRIKAALAASQKSLEFFDVPNNMEEISMLIELAMKFIDIETGIPMPQQGEETRKTDTVGGMAILQNAANIIFRRVVKNVDDGLIAPTMRRLYDWNMQFSKRAEIKGDMQVDARGTSVLLVKEVQAQNLMTIVTTLMANPLIQPMLKAYPSISKLFQAMMIKPSEVMISEDEYKKYLDDQAKAPPPKSPQEIAAEARIESANIMAEVKKSSDEVMKEIAQLRERTALIDLAAKSEISLEELRTMLEGKKLDHQHKERMMVGEAAIDRQNAAEERAHGETPGGSGGSFNEGPAHG